jgi:hypothetical protein
MYVDSFVTLYCRVSWYVDNNVYISNICFKGMCLVFPLLHVASTNYRLHLLP